MRCSCLALGSQDVARSALFSLRGYLLARACRCVGLIDGSASSRSAGAASAGHETKRPLADPRPHACGCRLRPGALEACVTETWWRLWQGADLLVPNTFGRQKRNGRGFRGGVIAEALALRHTGDRGTEHTRSAAFELVASGLEIRLPAKLEPLRPLH